jgi:hypothetical protein
VGSVVHDPEEADMMRHVFSTVALAMLASACTADAAPDDTDLAIVFTEGGCEVLRAPRGSIPSSIRIGAKNPTAEDYGVAVVTLEEGATKADLPFLDRFLTLIVPDREGDWVIEEVELVPAKENFVVCGHSAKGAVAVPVVLIPR